MDTENNTFDLNILPVVPDPTNTKLKRPIDPRLPDISTGQMGIFISPTKTGKSTIISNLLLNPNFYADLFDMVYIISNTIENDKTSRFLKKKFPNTIYNKYSDDIIENILNYQESFEPKDRPFIAIIMDDFVGIKAHSKVFFLSTRFRHYNIGLLVFASQLFRAVPAIVRQNATFALIGSPNPNGKELLKMAEELGSQYDGDKNFLKLYRQASQKKYDFLYLDLQSNPSKAYRNFNDLIYESKGISALDQPELLTNTF